MRVVDGIDQIRKELDAARAGGLEVGLVPTMGALHEGHGSLVRRSASECGFTAVTVFVNPLQFGSGPDLASYPRRLDADVARAEAAGADVVFAPSEREMYPAGVDGAGATRVRAGGPVDGLEGRSRPGHFDGVATVVTKLFALAGTCRAYFGEKDYQQLLVVRSLASDLSFPVEVVACPTVRQPDGLALSSRNDRLSPAEREAATVLWRALTAAAALVRGGTRSADAVRSAMVDTVGAEPLAHLEYAVVADPHTLSPVERVVGETRLLVAATIGGVRLIDNLVVGAG